MGICFEGVGQVTATFQAADGAVKPGQAVTLTAGSTVGLGAAGAALCGVALSGVRGGAAAVQIGGAVQVGYSGSAAPAVGWQVLVCDGAGGVKTAEDGVKYLVLSVDTDGKTAVIKL